MRWLVVLLLSFALVGCSSSRIIIDKLHYKNSIDLKVPNKAYIYWIPGEHNSHEVQDYSVASGGGGLGGLVANLAIGVIKQQDKKNNPSKYFLEYGKADESVFITSLRNTLDAQGVFKTTDIITNLDQVNPSDVLITIYFKNTRIDHAGMVTLSAHMSIKTKNKQAFSRTYFVQSDDEPKGFLHTKGLLEMKTESSQKLLALIINGIKQYYQGEYK